MDALKLTKLDNDQLVIENAHLIYRNLEGKKDKFNTDGKRSFGVVIDDEDIAAELNEMGLKIKQLKPRDEEDEPRWWMKINLKINEGERARYNPKIFHITNGGGKAKVEDEYVKDVDSDDIAYVDVQFRLYSGTTATGMAFTTAWLVSMYVVLEEDYLDRKWED